jgi:hypothetical protein
MNFLCKQEQSQSLLQSDRLHHMNPSDEPLTFERNRLPVDGNRGVFGIGDE